MCLKDKSESRCTSGQQCRFRHVEADEKHSRKSKKGGAKGSVAFLKESTQLGCVSQDSHPRKSFLQDGKLVPNHTVKFSTKIRERKVHREASLKSVNVTSAIRALPDLRTGHKTKRCTKKDAHRRVAWEMYTSSKIRIKLRFTLPMATLAPTSKSPEEREFVVDSRASMYMLSKKDLSSDEMETLRRFRNPTTVVTASGEVQTSEEAQVHVHDLDLFVTVQVLDDTPAVLSKTTDIPMSGSAVKHTVDQRGRRQFYVRRKFSNLLLSLECRQVLAPARLLHRHRRTRQVHLQVQQQSEVAIRYQETGEDSKSTSGGNLLCLWKSNICSY